MLQNLKPQAKVYIQDKYPNRIKQNFKAVKADIPEEQIEPKEEIVQQPTEIKQEIAENIQQEVVSNVIPQKVAQNQDGAQIWMNILSAIQSLPARAFYSGVAKLVGVDGNKIKLGFLHENLIAQAKSEMKFNCNA